MCLLTSERAVYAPSFVVFSFHRGALCSDMTPALAIHTKGLVAEGGLPRFSHVKWGLGLCQAMWGLSFRFTKCPYHLCHFLNINCSCLAEYKHFNAPTMWLWVFRLRNQSKRGRKGLWWVLDWQCEAGTGVGQGWMGTRRGQCPEWEGGGELGGFEVMDLYALPPWAYYILVYPPFQGLW